MMQAMANPVSAIRGTRLEERRRLAALDREHLVAHQLQRLNRLLAEILPANRFYADKLADLLVESPTGSSNSLLKLASLDDLARLPYTYKEELLGAPQHDAWGAANRTYALERYVRFHQTSGTHGRPLVVLDTADDWQWWLDCWQYVLDAAELGPADRLFMAFSFGPYIGFWSAHDAAIERGCLVIPGGGMNTLGRLEAIRASGATAVFCTPSYALHLAEVGAANQLPTSKLKVRTLVLAGEPGGSIPSVRQRIEEAWNARVIDHAGASEIGAWGIPDRDGRGLHVLESEFMAEFLAVESGEPAAEGELAELVLTTLGRAGYPVIRYRTGDLVRPTWNTIGENRFVFLEGGVLGRSDDMIVVRGVNIFPSAIEEIVRGFPEVAEYRLTASKAGAMDKLHVEIEDRLSQPERVARELQLRLGLRIDVTLVASGSLPRFEGKGRRFVDER